ncbi:MAG: UvrD-helicase domain-containing protein [Alphaproteobacteria bacterium]|nr:UvrD-helicase domain-containing protein [Alphaproteobacteria bacterium]MBL6936790.1 UvrD-helicase domain-containing protein [Alphaproteobacteria bacterium]MBL7097559.1 UvrD-helicase domain-containing protein [Alphaproteobacteria bacterium]
MSGFGNRYNDPLDEAFGEDVQPVRAQAAAAEPPYLKGLNPEQREAVLATDGPVLVLAGAGTGKTRVLTTRLAHILATRRAWPGQILSVTFTNKAAREMKERIGALIGGVVEGMQWLGTFHSIGAKMLRRHAELVGLKSNFTILDTDDQLRLMKQLIDAANIDEKRWPARALAGMIDAWKNRGLSPQDVPSGEGHGFAFGKGTELYAQYQQRLKDLNAADFGDLLLHTLNILKTNPDILADYRERFRYILVDEYQDTNAVQYLWLKILGTASGNVCVVGDDDQSIYAWRGAEVENILRFERDFPGAKVIRLERNYRSTPVILGAASGLITANKGRLGKTLWTEGDPGEKIKVQGVWDAEEEARNIASEAEDLHRNMGQSYGEMAILVRAAFQMREFEDRFIALGLPYRVIGGPRFYERQEVRDAMAYLRLIAQGDDDLAFERIVNKPKRGIGDASVQALHVYARNRQLPLLAAAREIAETDELPPKARKALAELAQNFSRWTQTSQAIPHTELAEMVLDESGYTDMLKNDKSAEAPGRLENLKEFVRSMETFESLTSFLEHVSLVMEIAQDESGDRINLMTLHAAKGLEFNTVFLPGWEEGLFPSQRTMDENGLAGLEEERRLAYVGITRAKQRARVSFAANRRVHGSWQSALPSRFITELPEEHVDTVVDEGFYGGNVGFRDNMNSGGFASTYDSPGWKRAQANRAGGMARARPPTIEAHAYTVQTSDPESSQYTRGDRIFHQKFGYGRVSFVEGNKLTVDFDKAGEKKVIDTFVQRA